MSYTNDEWAEICRDKEARIAQLMKKIEKLEAKIEKLEKDREPSVTQNIYRCPVCDKKMPTVPPDTKKMVWCDECYDKYDKIMDFVETVEDDGAPILKKEETQ